MLKNLLKKLFYFKDKDSHYIIQLFGTIQMSFRHKSNFKYIEAKNKGTTDIKRNPQLVVSLTSFPDRINYIYKTINTLLLQTLKPDRVILWLAEEQFRNKENDLPENLLKLKNLGLEIKWCEDLKSYKKLLPALREFPDDIIVTADDDMFYEKNWLKALYEAYLKNPEYIYVHRACHLKVVGNKIQKYSQREGLFRDDSAPSYLNSLFGGSGCLYRPNSLDKEVFNVEKLKQIAPMDDDLWFWAMAVLNGVKIAQVSGKNSNLYPVDETLSTPALYKTNTPQNHLKTYENLLLEYPKIFEKLKQESDKENNIKIE